MKTELIIDIVGWLGAISAVYGYFLVSTNRVKGDSLSYQLLNIVGALALILNSSYHGAMPSAIVNVIWVGVGLYALNRSGFLSSGFRYFILKKKKIQ